MDTKAKENLDRIGALAHEDQVYRELLARCKALEGRFDKVAAALAPEEQALLWEFVMLTEERSVRKLELACRHMEFVPDTAEHPGK